MTAILETRNLSIQFGGVVGYPAARAAESEAGAGDERIAQAVGNVYCLVQAANLLTPGYFQADPFHRLFEEIAVLSLKALFPQVEALKHLHKSGILLSATVLFFLTKILTVKDLEQIPWNIILLFGGAMSIGFCLWPRPGRRGRIRGL